MNILRKKRKNTEDNYEHTEGKEENTEERYENTEEKEENTEEGLEDRIAASVSVVRSSAEPRALWWRLAPSSLGVGCRALGREGPVCL